MSKKIIKSIKSINQIKVWPTITADDVVRNMLVAKTSDGKCRRCLIGWLQYTVGNTSPVLVTLENQMVEFINAKLKKANRTANWVALSSCNDFAANDHHEIARWWNEFGEHIGFVEDTFYYEKA